MMTASARLIRVRARVTRRGLRISRLRDAGTIGFSAEVESPACAGACALDADELCRLEPLITLRGQAFLLPECSVDPRKLGSALEKTARHRGVTSSPARR